ncbi:MAG: phosphatidate cytidylyltransferase [Verrucomicrobia bacterium]|nr:phosphatidate cytidylyltransferase [Verrucomicrobiota bacterium]
MIVQRTISTVVLAVVFIVAPAFAYNVPGSIVLLVVMNLTLGLGLFEFYDIVEKKGSTSLMLYGIIAGLVYNTFSFLTAANGPIGLLPPAAFTSSFYLLIVVFFIMQLARRDGSSAIYNFSGTIGGIIYVAWFFGFVAQITYFDKTSTRWWLYFAMTILVTKGTDVGAYLVGSLVGRTPLAPRVSPKKTVEGAAAGLIVGILAGIACAAWLPFPRELALWRGALVGAVLSVVGQFGDVAESVLKRDAGVKDSGARLPGLGGVLDVIDSMLFATPLMHFFMVFGVMWD